MNTFVVWCCGHLVRYESGCSLALCDRDPVRQPMVVQDRCPECMEEYLRTMTATDELVGMFGEDGRVKT